VRLETYVPQTLVLSQCDAFVTHAGFNSAKESLNAGVPMVAVPITADQPYCAGRVAALGAAKVVGPDGRTADAICAAVREVLSDTAYRKNARAFQKQMHALPGPDAMVDRLEALAKDRVGAAS
jgi:N-glycosyltransferase